MGCAICRAGHGLLYATPSRTPPDPTLFPSYMQNERGFWLRFVEWWPRPMVPHDKLSPECDDNTGNSTSNTQDIKAVVFIVSGLGEHANRYDSVALRLNREGFVCFSVDNVGAGGSEGCRLYVECFDHFVDDVLAFVRHIHAKYPWLQGMPQQLLGHSMGGLIATYVAAREPKLFAAVVLSGPAFVTPVTPRHGSLARWFVFFCSRYFPGLAFRQLNAEFVSHNRAVVELVKQDPFYANNKLRARFLAELMSAQDRALEKVKSLEAGFPLLILFGEDDKLCDLEAARTIFEHFPSKDKEMRTYPHAGHEVLTELDRVTILNDMVDFMNEHTLKEPAS